MSSSPCPDAFLASSAGDRLTLRMLSASGLVVVASVAVIAVIGLAAAGAVGWAEAPALAWFAGISLLLSAVDLSTRRLPNAIVLPSYPVVAVLLAAAAAATGEPWRVAGAAAGAAVLFGLYFAMAVAVPGGMGWGDVKLAGVIGLVLGWGGWAAFVVGAGAAFVLGGAAAAVQALRLAALAQGPRRATLAFGPWMLAGAWVGVLAP